MVRSDLPTGTVTFLFTDVEGSTKLLHGLGEQSYADALAEHRRALPEIFARHDGVEVDTEGDAFFVAFPTARGALSAAADSRATLEGGPISVRIGVHTGTPLRTDEGYVGVDVHRAARIAAAGHGGQVLVSAATSALVGEAAAELVDLGDHRLKDLEGPERIYQLGEGSFPPLKSLSPSNLPAPTTPFLGREAELAQVTDLLRDDAVRALTVTGPGGVGKTRLAVRAAAEVASSFPDGIWWVALAPLRDAGLVPAAIAQVLGVRENGAPTTRAIADHLDGRRVLLLLDNAEHLMPRLADELAPLLEAADWTLLVTSRERLHLGAEQVFSVLAMSAPDSEAFVIARARAAGTSLDRSDALVALCERLDRLPLALQLAAARLSMFSPEQMLGRLSRRLDELKGALDVDPRQHTLRATIGWSHDLLSDDAQELFRRLAVFLGGCTLEAAEAVCGTDVDLLQSLLDKSLVQRRDDRAGTRFWMLESIREFAAERLEESDELQRLRARHAEWFRGFAERMDEEIRRGEPEEGPVGALGADIDNLRAAVTFGLETGDTAVVRAISAALPMFWIVGGQYGEARAWLDRALALDDAQDETRRRLLSGLATIAHGQGDYSVAIGAADEAARLAMELGGVTERYDRLRSQARAAGMKGDVERAEVLWEEALRAAKEVDNGVGMSACRLNLADLANKMQQHERAESLLRENLPFVRSRGQSRCEAYTLAQLGETAVYRRRPKDAADRSLEGARRAHLVGEDLLLAFSLDVFAAAAARGEPRRVAAILGSTEAAREAAGVVPDEVEQGLRNRALERLRDALEEGPLADAIAQGRALDLVSALELATSD